MEHKGSSLVSYAARCRRRAEAPNDRPVAIGCRRRGKGHKELVQMSAEISRRGFLALGGAALRPDNGEDRGEPAPWWASCATSPEFRRLAQASAAEGILIAASTGGPYHFSFIDDDFPVSRRVSLPPALARRELQV